jgi:hypothetical protein
MIQSHAANERAIGISRWPASSAGVKEVIWRSWQITKRVSSRKVIEMGRELTVEIPTKVVSAHEDTIGRCEWQEPIVIDSLHQDTDTIGGNSNHLRKEEHRGVVGNDHCSAFAHCRQQSLAGTVFALHMDEMNSSCGLETAIDIRNSVEEEA